jgi:hypothetical protein
MKHLQSFKLFESSESNVLATNMSSYHFSHDDTASDTNLERIAKIYLEGNDVWLEIREVGSITGPYERKENAHIDRLLAKEKIGNISKPDLNKVRTILKEKSFDRTNTRFASGFKAQWKNSEGKEFPLSDILGYKGVESPTKRKVSNREDIIQEIGYKIQQLSDEKLQQILNSLSEKQERKPVKIGEEFPTISTSYEPVNYKESYKIVDYSERSVAIFGVKKNSPILDSLRHLGGKFNPFLVNPQTGEKEAGWIFPIGKKSELMALINY